MIDKFLFILGKHQRTKTAWNRKRIFVDGKSKITTIYLTILKYIWYRCIFLRKDHHDMTWHRKQFEEYGVKGIDVDEEKLKMKAGRHHQQQMYSLPPSRIFKLPVNSNNKNRKFETIFSSTCDIGMFWIRYVNRYLVWNDC